MNSPLFSQDRIAELQTAVIQARLSRKSLLLGIDKVTAAGLSVESNPADQILSDLTELMELGVLVDGSVPLRTWLKNAILLSGLRAQNRTFNAALAELEAKLGPHPGASPTASTGWTAPQASPQTPWVGSPAGQSPTLQQAAPMSPNPWPAPPIGPSPEASDPSGSGGSGAHGKRVVRIYLSATMNDRPLVERLERHLKTLVALGVIEVWHRGRIRPGDDERAAAAARLGTADLICPFISADYFSDPNMEIERRDALSLSVSRGARVVPILARPILWKVTNLGHLMALPKSGSFLTSASDLEQACVEIAEAIASLVQEIGIAASPSPTAAGAPSPAGAEPKVASQDPSATAGEGPPASLLDQASFPWRDRRADKLHGSLVAAYSSHEEVLLLARKAGILTAAIHVNTSVSHLWAAILEAAASQGKMRRLMELISEDGGVRAHWKQIAGLVDWPE